MVSNLWHPVCYRTLRSPHQHSDKRRRWLWFRFVASLINRWVRLMTKFVTRKNWSLKHVNDTRNKISQNLHVKLDHDAPFLLSCPLSKADINGGPRPTWIHEIINHWLIFARFNWLFWSTWYQIGGRVSGNTPRQRWYLPYDFSVARMHDKVNNVSSLSVFIFTS